jgi:hypothetical protein
VHLLVSQHPTWHQNRGCHTGSSETGRGEVQSCRTVLLCTLALIALLAPCQVHLPLVVRIGDDMVKHRRRLDRRARALRAAPRSALSHGAARLLKPLPLAALQDLGKMVGMGMHSLTKRAANIIYRQASFHIQWLMHGPADTDGCCWPVPNPSDEAAGCSGPLLPHTSWLEVVT